MTHYTVPLCLMIACTVLTKTYGDSYTDAITVDRCIELAKLATNDYIIAEKALSHDKIIDLYEEKHTSWFSTLLERSHIMKPSVASGVIFYKLINQLSQERTLQGLKGDNVVYAPHAPGKKLIVWGNIQGAFATFVQSIAWLYKQGIIDQTLTITKNDYVLVFNGNMIGPYFHSMETLTIIAALMKQNPQKVLYIRGPYENEEGWLNIPLKEQLLYQTPYTFIHRTEFKTVLKDFFATLPLALYISINGTHNLINITSGTINISEISEFKTLGTLFTKTENNTIDYHALRSPYATTTKVFEKVRITTAQNPTDARIVPGLGLLEPANGAIQWGILSAPMQNTLTLNTIHNNAFSIITLNNELETSTITLYQTPINSTEDFKLGNSYYLMSGIPQAMAPASQMLNKPVEVGSSMALVQGVPVLGQLIQRGTALRINEINQKGGIDKRTIHLTIYNDNYIPHTTRSNILKLIDNTILSILLPVGSPTLSSYLTDVIEGKVSVFFPVTGASTFRSANIKHIVHFRGSYDDEVNALLHNLTVNYGIKKFAFFYQSDSYGLGPLAAAESYLKKHGITEWTRVAYSRANTDFTLQAKALLEAQPEAIGFFATAQAGEAVIREVGIENCFGRQLFGISFFAEETFRRFAERHGIPVMYGSVVPNPISSQLEIVRDYRTAMNTINKRYDVFSLEAYIATSLLLHAIEQVGTTVTNETLMTYFEQLKDYNFKGINLNFNPETRSLARNIWLEDTSSDAWPQIDIAETTAVPGTTSP